jgi:hypothetical protein
MPRYYWKDDDWRDREGNPMPRPERHEICMPIVRSDIQEYRSPVDGKLISSRSTRRYDLEASGCVEAEPRKKRGYANPKFALKRGLKLNEEAETKYHETPKDLRPAWCRTSGCVEAEPRKKRGYANPKFALKRGLKLNEEAETKYHETPKDLRLRLTKAVEEITSVRGATLST